MTAPDARATSSDSAVRYETPPTPTASGPFVWHDLMSTHPARSIAFYTALFGWRTETKDVGPGGAYTYLHAGDQAFGGIVPFEAVHGWPSHWVSYVAVDDVDATCARAAAGGGSTCIPPTDIPNVGRFAMIADPAGAILSPIALPHGRRPTAGPSAPGTAWWHELATADPVASAAFYRAVFGWQIQEVTMPDGPYWLFARGESVMHAGGMTRLPGDAVRPHWTVYVAVDDVDATVAHAESLGATRLGPCTDVPAGRIGHFVDPTGAAIAVGRSAPMP